MALSTAMSVASFSVVLAETFASVGLSTLVPNAFLALAKASQPATPTPTPIPTSTSTPTPTESPLEKALKESASFPASQNPTNVAITLLKAMAKSTSSVDLLVPKSASIDAEFEFYGSESYSVGATVCVAVEMVTVKGGFSALYETHSNNKVKLHVEFVTVGASLA